MITPLTNVFSAEADAVLLMLPAPFPSVFLLPWLSTPSSLLARLLIPVLLLTFLHAGL